MKCNKCCCRSYKKKLKVPYPSPEIVQKIKELGGKFTLGDDSHGPNEVALHYDELFQFIKINNVSYFLFSCVKKLRLTMNVYCFFFPMHTDF